MHAYNVNTLSNVNRQQIVKLAQFIRKGVSWSKMEAGLWCVAKSVASRQIVMSSSLSRDWKCGNDSTGKRTALQCRNCVWHTGYPLGRKEVSHIE